MKCTVMFLVTSCICLFPRHTNLASKLPNTLSVWDDQQVANSIKIAWAANWTQDCNRTLFLTGWAFVNFTTDAHQPWPFGEGRLNVTTWGRKTECHHLGKEEWMSPHGEGRQCHHMEKEDWLSPSAIICFLYHLRCVPASTDHWYFLPYSLFSNVRPHCL